jgi:hypothetical protein
VILADTEGHENLGRIVNDLGTAKEFVQNHEDSVEVIFDGAGTEWIPEIADPGSDQYELFAAVRNEAVACAYCAEAFGVKEEVTEANVDTRTENDGHSSIRSLVADGYEVITY